MRFKIEIFGSSVPGINMGFWKQHPIKQQLYGYLPPILQTIQVRLATHAGHCWRNKDKYISNVFLWTSTHDQPAKTNIYQLCVDTGYCLENLLIGMEGERESSESVLFAYQDNDDDNDFCLTCGVLTKIAIFVFLWFLCLMAYQPFGII